jgi:Oxidoreductase family, NAD-binding Rossmann fold
MQNRRQFIISSAITGIGIAASSRLFAKVITGVGLRIGIIGLDTSHCIEFTKILNDPTSGDTFGGYKVVAAYPKGSIDIKSSIDRIACYTEQLKTMGIDIVDSISSLLEVVDVALLETNDGRRHLEQAIPVLKAGKRLFIDKPITASLSDAMILFEAAKFYNIPVFSSSSCRFIDDISQIKNGAIGKVIGAEAHSPATLEATHPDLFWYGIHGVEILYSVMGTGCKSVVRVSAPDTDVVVGTWNDGRIGTFRGTRSGTEACGAEIFGENDIKTINISDGFHASYKGLMKEVTAYFKTGNLPVQPEETLEILAFMEAANESKKRSGTSVAIDEIMKRARLESKKCKF